MHPPIPGRQPRRRGTARARRGQRRGVPRGLPRLARHALDGTEPAAIGPLPVRRGQGNDAVGPLPAGARQGGRTSRCAGGSRASTAAATGHLGQVRAEPSAAGRARQVGGDVGADPSGRRRVGALPRRRRQRRACVPTGAAGLGDGARRAPLRERGALVRESTARRPRAVRIPARDPARSPFDAQLKV